MPPTSCIGAEAPLRRRRSALPSVERGCSSDGRALQSHCRGQGFDSPQLHQANPQKWLPKMSFSVGYVMLFKLFGIALVSQMHLGVLAYL
jgi:hypothetical protein